jgi:tetratricopeptide (TPR) repeat protein
MLEKGRQAVERFATSKDPSMLDTLGWLYYRLDKMDQAVSTLAKAASATDKVAPEIYYHYGAALLKSGNKSQAKIELTKAVSADAKYPALEEAKKLLNSI